MKPVEQPASITAARTRRLVRGWLLGACATLALLVAAALLAPHFIDSDYIKGKIQKTVDKQLGGQLNYQGLEVVILPRPAIELHQATLSIPGRLEGSVDTVSIVPKLLSLLRGELRLAGIELASPEFTVDLPAASTTDAVTSPYDHAELVMGLVKTLESLHKVTPTLKLQIAHGQLLVRQGTQELATVDDLTLETSLLVIDDGAAQASVEGTLDALILQRQGHQETIKGVRLNGSAKLALGNVTVSIDELALAEPALALSGELVLAPTAPAITLQLNGRDIDVDATRSMALSLAGDNQVVTGLFRYLRGGRVPQLSVHLQGESPAALGEFRNIRIDGQLQGGAVAIPQIPLDLTEVVGDVRLTDGILQGTHMSTRLENSTGHDGTLKVDLGEPGGLFQLELMMSADLAQAQRVLARIVEDPDFVAGLAKINALKGSGTGKLLLGDRLDRLKARLEVKDFNLSATYQGVPLPIEISNGQLTFTEKRTDIKTLQGSIGQSRLSAVAGSLSWEEPLDVDLRAGPSTLVLDELYPWLASLDGTQEALQGVKQLSGQLELQSLSFKGGVDHPEQWQIAASGSVHDLELATSRSPAPVKLASGTFNIADGSGTFADLHGTSLDADLVLGGRLSGLPRQPEPVELSLAGTLGPEAVAWLRDAFTLPQEYTLRAPVNLTATRILWQEDATTAFLGNLAIAGGPELTFDATYRPGRLNVRQLTIKDQYSDARLAYSHNPDERSLNFAGKLQHQTLADLFVEPLFGKGQLQGDIHLRAPRTQATAVTAKGQLQGDNLTLPLPEGDQLEITGFELAADGSRVNATVTSLTWHELTWQPLKGVIDFAEGKIAANISEAKLCGIDSPGLVTLDGKALALDLTLTGKGLDVARSYSCMTNGHVKMTGTLDFTSKVSAHGEISELVNKLKGPLAMTFSNGVIEEDKVLARLLEVLNVTEIVKGRLPKLETGGFPYTSITVQGLFKDGKLLIKKLDMDGETLDVLGHGELDIAEKSVNVELMAAPFKTVDTVVKNIPGVNYLLADSLVAIPVSIKGELLDPKISIMSISSVGSSLLGLGERTLKAPIKLIETILPGKND